MTTARRRRFVSVVAPLLGVVFVLARVMWAIACLPQGYLADQAVAWARAEPGDTRAAEALALAVEGGRWACSVPASSRRAFQTMHRLFPQSEWAKRTRHWYDN